LFVFDRLGAGTLGIEAINFIAQQGPTGPTGSGGGGSGNLVVQDEGGNIVTAVGTITFAGSGIAEVTVAPPTGTGSATVTVTVNPTYFQFRSGD
jgi:hypothetical protein